MPNANYQPSLSAIVAMWLALALLPFGASRSHQSSLRLEQRDTLSLNFDASPPSNASNVVDKSYPAFAMSAHSFPQYAGNLSSPNAFSANLIQSVAERTGTNVYIRVGGTSGDFSRYDPNQKKPIVFPPEYKPGGIPKNMSLGPVWFEGFKSFPGVQWTYSTHFANNSAGMKENSVLATQEALKYIGDDLVAIEIGNEINFYPGVNRPADYNVVKYLEQWTEYQEAIDQSLGAAQKYQAPVYYNNTCPWCIANTFEKGQAARNNVISASLHNYMDQKNLPTSDLQSHYMNHTRIANELDIFRKPINWLAANHPNIAVDLGEVNSNTYSKNNVDLLGVFGSTLWLADYMLYGTTINVRRMNVQQSTAYSYASWRGVEDDGKPAAVLPPYYAHPFVADVLGKSGSTRVASIATGRDLFSAYGVYENNSLARIAIINFREYSKASGKARPSTTISLSAGNHNGQVAVERLTAPGAHELNASEVSWAGLSWSKDSNGKSYQSADTTTTVMAEGGKFEVTLPDSSAVLLSLGGVLLA